MLLVNLRKVSFFSARFLETPGISEGELRKPLLLEAIKCFRMLRNVLLFASVPDKKRNLSENGF